MTSNDRHGEKVQQNHVAWRKKPLLRKIYQGFHELAAGSLPDQPHGLVVELGSGVPNIAETIPGCIRTDIVHNPTLDRIENAYALSFPDATVSALVLFDVFHHLKHPGRALEEFRRVLMPRGRVVIFEPDIGLLGLVIYGLLHDEPLGLRDPIQWHPPSGWSPTKLEYYAAQANAWRVFVTGEIDVAQFGWRLLSVVRLSAISYVLSGGYSRPQMYPDSAFSLVQLIDKLCDRAPSLFATRLLAVLEKPSTEVAAYPYPIGNPGRHAAFQVTSPKD
jgi:SAM-dependent methyltransferase